MGLCFFSPTNKYNFMDYFLIYKPFQVLSQFTSTEGKLCLKDILHVPTDVYPVGRLDYDSEGLLLITNDKSINQQLLNLDGKAYQTKSAKLELLPDSVQVPDRNPPIRFRKNIPTSWVAIQVTEGKNRQVRKMFAQVGFPVLRLIRAKLGKYTIQDMQPGDCLSLTAAEVQQGFFR